MMLCSANLWSEPLAALLLLAAFVVGWDASRPRKLFFSAALLGLACHARGEVRALVVLATACLLMRTLQRPSSPVAASAGTETKARLASWLLGLGATLPLVALESQGAPDAHYRALFRVVWFDDLLHGYLHAPALPTSVLGFLAHNIRAVGANMGDNAVETARILFFPDRFLLGPLILVTWRLSVIPGLGLVAVTTMMWFTRDGERLLLVPIALLVGPVSAALASRLERLAHRFRRPLSPVMIGACVGGIALCWTVVRVQAVHQGMAQPRDGYVWETPPLRTLGRRLDLLGLRSAESVALTFPWSVQLHTAVPVVALPALGSQAQLQRFLRDHPHVRAIVTRPAAPYAGIPEDWPEDWLPQARWETLRGGERLAILRP
jgi:hypothetical protein